MAQKRRAVAWIVNTLNGLSGAQIILAAFLVLFGGVLIFFFEWQITAINLPGIEIGPPNDPQYIVYETKPDIVIEDIFWEEIHGYPYGIAVLNIGTDQEYLVLNVSYDSKWGERASLPFHLERSGEHRLVLYEPIFLKNRFFPLEIEVCYTKPYARESPHCVYEYLDKPTVDFLVEPQTISLESDGMIETEVITITNLNDFKVVNWLIYCHKLDYSDIRYPNCGGYLNLEPGQSTEVVLQIYEGDIQYPWLWDSYYLDLVMTPSLIEDEYFENGMIKPNVGIWDEFLVSKRIRLEQG